jgi:hypothetical protein
MTKLHTPGPWAVGDETDFYPDRLFRPINAGLGEIALVHVNDEKTGMTNARLIAAAPDLLFELQNLLKWDTDLIASDPIAYQIDQENARAAIAKATNPNPRYVVDGHESTDEESAWAGDGQFPPFAIFDTQEQRNLVPFYPTRKAAELAMKKLQGDTP